MTNIVWQLQNEEETVRVGRLLASVLPAGSVVSLLGTLGAGKTRLVRAVAEALGIDPAIVVSPTFVLIREYEGRMPLYHFDAYRLKDEDEFDQLGPDEYFDGEGLSFVEWADRVALSMPKDRLEILIEVTGTNERRMTMTPRGNFPLSVMSRLAEGLADRS